MYSLITLVISSFVVGLVLTPAFRNLSLCLGWVDKPDNRRKIHRQPIPRAGGVPIVLAYLGAFGVLFLLGTGGGHLVAHHSRAIWRLVPAALLVFAVGILDDILGLQPWQKFAGQFAAAGLAWLGGVQIHAVYGSPLPTWLALPLTFFWLVGCTNAFNLIDGLDGLATGIGVCAASTMFVAALISGDVTLQYATAPLVGALLGFLRYNFNPASVFLGDSGSLTVGFLLGCFGVLWSQKAASALGMAAPLFALALPLIDTALAIVRRFLRGQPIFGADRGHIHHRLLDRGFTVKGVALLLYGVCGLAAVASLLLSAARNRFGGLALLLFCAVVWYGVQRLEYGEFSEARRLIFGGLFRRVLIERLQIARFEHQLSRAATANACWEAIVDLCLSLGFDSAYLTLSGLEYQQRFIDNPGECWNITVPLKGDDFIHLSLPFSANLQPTVVSRLASVLRANLVSSVALRVISESSVVNSFPETNSQPKPLI